MFSFFRWFMGGLCLCIATGIIADEPEEPLSAEFLQYLAEFSDDQGEMIDPEILADFLRSHQAVAGQESAKARIASDRLAEEVTP